MSHWISVEDKTPEDINGNSPFVATYDLETERLGIGFYRDKEWLVYEGNIPFPHNVTHWTELYPVPQRAVHK